MAGPRLTISKGEQRFAERFGAVVAKLGLEVQPRRGFVAERKSKDLVQRLIIERWSSRGVAMRIAIEDSTLSPLLQRALQRDAPVPLLDVPLHASWFARFYSVRAGDRGDEILDTSNARAARDFDFAYAVCHALCVNAAVRDASRVTKSFVMPFFARMSSLAALEKWWNTGWDARPKPDQSEAIDPRRDEFRFLASRDVPWAYLGVALAAAVGRPHARRSLSALGRKIAVERKAPFPFTQLRQARRFISTMQERFG